MTLNGIILRYFTEFGSFRGALRKSSRLLSHLLMSACIYQAAGPRITHLCDVCIAISAQCYNIRINHCADRPKVGRENAGTENMRHKMWQK